MDVSSINPQYSMVHLRIWIDTKLDLSDLLFHPKYTYLETRIMQLVWRVEFHVETGRNMTLQVWT